MGTGHHRHAVRAVLIPAAPPWFDDLGFALFLLVCYVGGVLACHRTGQALGEPDHGSIVWDEIVPFWAALFFAPEGWLWWIVAFFLFRFFDIVKPFPANLFDRIKKNGFGVMTDDVFAAALYGVVSRAAEVHPELHLNIVNPIEIRTGPIDERDVRPSLGWPQ